MSLSCSCDYCPEPGDWYYDDISDYKPLSTRRGRRCSSCKELIKVGQTCVEAFRVKVPETDIEIKIYGEEGEIPLPSHFMCERCADLLNSLEELGFCPSPSSDQRELVRDYAETYGPKSKPQDHAIGQCS